MNWLSGKKTYIVALGIIVAAVVSFSTGEMTLAESINSALVGLGLGALRSGVAKQ